MSPLWYRAWRVRIFFPRSEANSTSNLLTARLTKLRNLVLLYLDSDGGVLMTAFGALALVDGVVGAGLVPNFAK